MGHGNGSRFPLFFFWFLPLSLLMQHILIAADVPMNMRASTRLVTVAVDVITETDRARVASA